MRGANCNLFLPGDAFSVGAVPVVACADEPEPGVAFAGAPAADAAFADVLGAFHIACDSSAEG